MSKRYQHTVLITTLILCTLQSMAQTIFVEMRSIPRTIILNLYNDQAKIKFDTRKRWFGDIESGREFKKHLFCGMNLSFTKDYFNYSDYYYDNHNRDEFWHRSLSSGVFIKKIVPLKKLMGDDWDFYFFMGIYVFFSHAEFHQLIAVKHYYGIYEIPINIKENKLSYSFQLGNWMKIYRNLSLEPAIQLGYYKTNPNLTYGANYISGQGMFLRVTIVNIQMPYP